MATKRTKIPPLLKLTPIQRKRIAGALDAKLVGAGLAHSISKQTGDEYHQKYMQAMRRYSEIVQALAVLGIELDEHELDQRHSQDDKGKRDPALSAGSAP